jgi:tetratricopeptide (TPR) repeat protein
MLSPAYQEIKSLRSSGRSAAAYSLLGSTPPSSDEDAFEAAVCLLICGDLAAMRHVCESRTWKESWAKSMAQALAVMVADDGPAQALAFGRPAARDPRAGYDAAAVFLMLLQANGLFDEADAYIQQRLPNPPANETFLLTVMAEIALAVEDWRQAYKLASAVMFADPDDFRALLTLSRANQAVGNYHEAFGNALRAHKIFQGSPQAILQMMRCMNKLGDYYTAIGMGRELATPEAISPEIHTELGTAYAGIDDAVRAEAEFRSALGSGPKPVTAIQGLAAILADTRNTAGLAELERTCHAEMHGDIECLAILGKAALARRDLDGAARLFEESRSLAIRQRTALHMVSWPVTEPRIRHDCEQLELLAQRGLLDSAGRNALDTLQRYYAQTGDVGKTFAPAGGEADALRHALATVHHFPVTPFSGPALGRNDYGAIEQQYRSNRPPVVAIDNFLSPGALAALRRHCEEANVWKLEAGEGYLGALLTQGFAPPVLLAIADELRQAMPHVIGDLPLLQAWGFKYDQRLQGINMHADFAKVNVNFWIAPDEACADKSTGGMVVYDVPAPTSWTFADYNTNQPKMQAFLEAQGARPMRVPYRENRCVLFDSSLIHITDELHFRPGYTNRRVNVTLLYGRARSIG